MTMFPLIFFRFFRLQNFFLFTTLLTAHPISHPKRYSIQNDPNLIFFSSFNLCHRAFNFKGIYNPLTWALNSQEDTYVHNARFQLLLTDVTCCTDYFIELWCVCEIRCRYDEHIYSPNSLFCYTASRSFNCRANGNVHTAFYFKRDRYLQVSSYIRISFVQLRFVWTIPQKSWLDKAESLGSLVIALRPQTPKHIKGGWSHTDTSEPVDGNMDQNMVTV
jgi:hypothetical protein